jgi:hypothetical protein
MTPQRMREIIQHQHRYCGCPIVLDELDAHQENTGESLESDDAGIIQQIKEAHPREALDAAKEQG